MWITWQYNWTAGNMCLQDTFIDADLETAPKSVSVLEVKAEMTH